MNSSRGREVPVHEPPQFLFIHVNQRCNLRCQHCRYWTFDDKNRTQYISLERKLAIIDEFSELCSGGSVVICGGESLLDLADFFAITNTCSRLGLRSLSVTNGTRIRDMHMAERMIAEGPDEVSVSLNSHLKSIHDETRGMPGSFERAVKCLRLLLEARQRHPERKTRVYVMGLVYAGNYKYLDPFYDFVLHDIKADKLKLNFLQPSFGNRSKVDEFFSRNSQIDCEDLAETIMACATKYRVNVNKKWLDDVQMYFRSLSMSNDALRGWATRSRTLRHICNSYERNIMVDLYGVARLCFSTHFRGLILKRRGDLQYFWENSDKQRAEMQKCNRFCGISHSVRRESATLR